ncbi:MAG: hypothetical protein AAGA23_05010 [Pseudomonadota bacterium]
MPELQLGFDASPASEPEPPRFMRQLGKGGQLVAWAIRSIVIAAQEDRVTPPSVENVLATAGASGAIFAITDLLSAVARGARREISIGPVKYDGLFPDEQRLLQVLAGVQLHPNRCHCRPLRELCHDSAIAEIMFQVGNLARILTAGQLHVIEAEPIPSPTLH